MNFLKSFGERLKHQREYCGLTQAELALKLGLKTDKTVWNYENGVREPKMETLILISKSLDVSIDYLLGLTDDPTPPGNR